jgi:hypothetical protein
VYSFYSRIQLHLPSHLSLLKRKKGNFAFGVQSTNECNPGGFPGFALLMPHQGLARFPFRVISLSPQDSGFVMSPGPDLLLWNHWFFHVLLFKGQPREPTAFIPFQLSTSPGRGVKSRAPYSAESLVLPQFFHPQKHTQKPKGACNLSVHRTCQVPSILVPYTLCINLGQCLLPDAQELPGPLGYLAML